MTRWIIALMLISLLALPLNAQMTPQQEKLLKPHVEAILANLGNQEKECQDLEKKYQDAMAKKQELETKLAQATSFFTKKKLQVQYLLAKKSAENAQAAWHPKQIQLLLDYCCLHAFGKKTMPGEVIAKVRQYLGDIDQYRRECKQQLAACQKVISEADGKLAEIADKQQKSQAEVTRLEGELQKLEANKTWGNLKDRMALKTKITMQKTNQLTWRTQEKYYHHKRKKSQDMVPQLQFYQLAAEVALAIAAGQKQKGAAANKETQK